VRAAGPDLCRAHQRRDRAHLFISEKTVGDHVSAVLAKMDVPTRNTAAMQATRLGLAPAEK
jgi:hypothetical protein